MNLGVFKNKEIKMAITSCTLVFFCSFFIFSYILKNQLNEINKVYIKQNIAIVGTIASKDKNIIKEVIPVLTNGDFKNYELGKKYLKDYGYNEELEYYKNPVFDVITYKELGAYKVFWLVLFIIILSVVILSVGPVFKNIKKLSSMVDEMMEGKYIKIDENLKEGDFYVLQNKFNYMAERLKNSLYLLQEEKNNLKNIINDISHQLKTPLSALIMYNEILKDDENIEVEERKRFINMSCEQLNRMEWLVITLLKFARLEASAIEFKRENCPLLITINKSLMPLIEKARDKNQKIKLENIDKIKFPHDSEWMAEAIGNIVKNALEHTGENGVIEIIGEETPLSIEIFIKDNGEGIEEENLNKIFKRFYKGENTINPTSIGIGLALSKSIIEGNGGSISVDSKLNYGTIFKITFLKTII